MAGDHAEISDPGIGVQLLTKQARGIFDKDRVGGVEFCERLFVFAFDHNLRFGRHSASAGFDQIFEPQALTVVFNLNRNPRDRALRMRRRQLSAGCARMLGKFQRARAGR